MAVVACLIEAGADVNSTCNDGQTILYRAVDTSNFGLIKLSLGEVAYSHDQDLINGENTTGIGDEVEKPNPLSNARPPGSQPNINTLDGDGESPLLLAIIKQSEDIVKLLLSLSQPVNFGAVDSDGNSELARAVISGNQNIVKALLDYGTDIITDNKNIATESKKGIPPLHWAVRKGYTEISTLLLDYGADVDLVDEEGYTPLHWAAQKGFIEVVKLLLDRGAKPDEVDLEGNIPLRHAACADIGKLLLDHGADTEKVNNQRLTAFHNAVCYGCLNFGRLLYGNECTVETIDKVGDTPLHDAVARGHTPFVKLLLETSTVGVYEPNPKSRGTRKPWTLYLEAKFSSSGSTVLHLAASNDHKDITNLLLDHNADASALNSDGATPLHLAVKEAGGTFACGIALYSRMDEKAIGIKDVDGNNALH